MSGDNEHDMDSLDSAPDQHCTGRCCGCGCSCDQCYCRMDHNVDNGANRNHYAGEGGTLPIDILARHLQHIHMADASFEEDIIDPNQAPNAPGASFALTLANLNQVTHSYNESNRYQEEWLNHHRRDVNENPNLHFLSPVDTEMVENEEGVFGAMELEGSMMVEDSVAGDSRSTISHALSHATCARSHSSRSASQVLAGVGRTPGFVSHPLPLLPDPILADVEEVTCPKCGCEHDLE